MTFWQILDFWRWSVLGVVVAGALCGFLGVYVLLRRVVFVSAALTQVSGVGIAAAFWFASLASAGPDPHHAAHPFYLSPALFGLGAAVLGAVLFAFQPGGRRVSSETVMGLGWIVASAAFLLVLSSKRIVQEAHEVDDLLYGSAVVVTPAQFRLLASVAAALFAVHLAFYKELLFVTYDAEMARALGYRTRLWDILLYVTFGVGISFAVRTVGALPAFGFLVIPAAAAQLLVRSVRWMFPLAVAFGVGGGLLGFALAVKLEVPTGAAIVGASSLFLAPGLLVAAAPLIARLVRGRPEGDRG